MRRGQYIFVQPPVPELCDRLQTIRHVACSSAEHGCRVERARQPLHEVGRDLGCPVVRYGAGLEPVVRHVLAEAGYHVRTVGGVPPLSAPDLDQVRKLGTCDIPFLETVRQHRRALVRYNDDLVSSSMLLAEIARAWTDKPTPPSPGAEGFWGQLSIVVAVARRHEAHEIRDRLRRHFPDTVVITSKEKHARVGRIAVATYGSLGHTPLKLAWRDVVVFPNALEALSQQNQEALLEMSRARLYGFLPREARPSPWDRDQLAALFGFVEFSVPRHGYQDRLVQLVRFAVKNGPRLPSPMKLVELKRHAFWNYHLRNRLIARLARKVHDGHVEEGVQTKSSFRKLKHGLDAELAKLQGMRRVVVLVEGVEHGLALAKHLPGWPLIAGLHVNMAGVTVPQNQLIEAGWQARHGNWTGAIVTPMGMKAVRFADVDVIIRADGGSGLLEIPSEELELPNDQPVRPLVLIDVVDRHQPQLRAMSMRRWAAYRRRGWYEVGVDPVQARINEFLARRPKGGRS
jgi:hypothetical protein